MSFKVEQMEEKNMVKLVIESTAEEFEAGLNKAYNKDKNKISIPGFRKGKSHHGKTKTDVWCRSILRRCSKRYHS